jgi:hypothetical protein
MPRMVPRRAALVKGRAYALTGRRLWLIGREQVRQQ